MKRFLWGCIALQLSGCAVTYVDAEGASRRIGLFSITEQPGPCSVVQTVTTAGVTVDTSPSTAGVNIGYRSVTTTQAPREGSVAFEVKNDAQLASYEREGAVMPNGRIACK